MAAKLGILLFLRLLSLSFAGYVSYSKTFLMQENIDIFYLPSTATICSNQIATKTVTS
jgi:hypothetical protein